MNRRAFYGRPPVYAAIGLCAGIFLGKYLLGLTGFLFVLACLLLAAIFIALRFAPRCAILLIACACGLARMLLAYPALPQQTSSCTLSGRVCELPATSYGRTHVVVDRLQKDGLNIEGKVEIHFPTSLPLAYGQRVEVEAALYPYQGPRNEGDMDARFHYLAKGIIAYAYPVGSEATIYPGKMDLYGRLLTLRQWATTSLTAMIGEENGAIAACMLHGDDGAIPLDLLRDFRTAGIAHLLAVSGLHVGLLVGALLLLTKRAGLKGQLVILSVFLLLFCMFTAFSASTMRASLMAVCLGSARVFGRRNDLLNSVSLAGLLLLLLNPFFLFTAGFQLSFCAVLGIAFFAPVFTDAFDRLPAPIVGALGPSIGAQLGTLPVTLVFFSRLPLAALFANFLAVPLAAFVVLPAGIALLLYPLYAPAATIVANIADTALELIRATAALAAKAGMLTLPAPSLLACLCFYAFMVFFSPYFLGEKRFKHLFAGTSALLFLLLLYAPRMPQNSITVLEVPQGYAVHVHAPGDDVFYATSENLYGAHAKSYLDYHGQSTIARVEAAPSGMEFALGGETISVTAGFVSINGTHYAMADNGQIQLSLRREKLAARAYAQERRYAILIQ